MFLLLIIINYHCYLFTGIFFFTIYLSYCACYLIFSEYFVDCDAPVSAIEYEFYYGI